TEPPGSMPVARSSRHLCVGAFRERKRLIMNSIRMLGVGAVLATLLAGLSASAQTAQQQPSNSPNQTTGSAPANVSRADQHFVTEAVQADLAEVQIGKLAQQKSDNADVKQYGQM